MKVTNLKKVLVASCMMLASFVHAAPMDELIALLSKFESYDAVFVQKTLDQNGEELQSLSGVMTLQKPDHFYWESHDPYAQKLVCNGKSIWHYDSDLEQVVIQEYAKQAQQAPVLVILRDAKTLSASFKVQKVERKGALVQFYLDAIDKKASLKTIELGFTRDVLSHLGFIDNLQQRTSIDFSSPVLNKKADPGLFEFILPAGVDVLYE